MQARTLVIACGAIARELTELARLNGWQHWKLQCLPPELHNRPERIPAAVGEQLERARGRYEHIFVAYADCGTGGALDRLLGEYGIERLPGAHCYEFFAGSEAFAALAAQEPGSFYLTDFLVRHFDRLIIVGLGLDRHPELQQTYFGNYRRVVYLAQTRSEDRALAARRCADRLGLDYHYHYTGLGPLAAPIRTLTEQTITWRS